VVPPRAWRQLRPATCTVPEALARSVELLARGDGPALVVHAVSPAAITVGRARVTTVDTAAAAREGLEVVTRPSGGGPVLWDDDLIAIDIVLPAGHPLLPADVIAGYRWVGEAVADALRALGIPGPRALPPHEARAWPRGDAADLCFGGLSPWEVVVGERKVLGLSQVRRQAGGIIQVGVPLRLDAARIARAVGAAPGADRDLATRTAGIGDLAPGVGRAQAIDALVTALVQGPGSGKDGARAPLT
jgi:lipoate---protein ligase